MLVGWRDPVEGVFEVRRKDGDAVILLNLVDDQRRAAPPPWRSGGTPRRLAAAHPDTVDAVFRGLLRKPGFTWSEHGEDLLHRRKPWYFEREPRPGVSVIGERLGELAAGTRPRFTRARRA
ncbi:hypothetical protein ACFYUY_08595 [Kitasatospora sp. NPDC004745]|uniref:hypothetical protein n=1 Tax=Kitasatospora sp. NPDC004745 TaxID=3364019 RepID=UPI0036BA51BD